MATVGSAASESRAHCRTTEPILLQCHGHGAWASRREGWPPARGPGRARAEGCGRRAAGVQKPAGNAAQTRRPGPKHGHGRRRPQQSPPLSPAWAAIGIRACLARARTPLPSGARLAARARTRLRSLRVGRARHTRTLLSPSGGRAAGGAGRGARAGRGGGSRTPALRASIKRALSRGPNCDHTPFPRAPAPAIPRQPGPAPARAGLHSRLWGGGGRRWGNRTIQRRNKEPQRARNREPLIRQRAPNSRIRQGPWTQEKRISKDGVNNHPHRDPPSQAPFKESEIRSPLSRQPTPPTPSPLPGTHQAFQYKQYSVEPAPAPGPASGGGGRGQASPGRPGSPRAVRPHAARKGGAPRPPATAAGL